MSATALALVITAALLHSVWNIVAKKAGGDDRFALITALMLITLWAPVGVWACWGVLPGWGWLEWGILLASAVVLVAHALQPLVLQRCVFAHRSGERGHALMLAHLNAQPLLDLGLRLGEGSGAALAWPLLQSACAVLREMASFAQAGVSTQIVG